MKKQLVLVNGEPAQWNTVPKQNDIIQFLEGPTTNKIYAFQVTLMYEDEHCAVVFKPGGLLVSGNHFKTLENALPFNLQLSKAKDALRQPRVGHRIDFATCGLVVVAKTASFLAYIKAAFEKKQVEKTYQAIVVGDFPENLSKIDTPIEGKEAITKISKKKVVPSIHFGALSLLEIDLLTGRRHQIRKHLSAEGFPVLGDQLYASPKQRLRGKGLFLCASKVRFDFDQEVKVETVCPGKFKKTLKRQKLMYQKKNGV